MSTMISDTTTYVAAFSSPPAIKCPDWCTVPLEDHLSRLPDCGGFAIHWSDDSGDVYHARGAYLDGAPWPDEPPLIYLNARGLDGLTLEQAERLANAILAAVKEERA